LTFEYDGIAAMRTCGLTTMFAHELRYCPDSASRQEGNRSHRAPYYIIVQPPILPRNKTLQTEVQLDLSTSNILNSKSLHLKNWSLEPEKTRRNELTAIYRNAGFFQSEMSSIPNVRSPYSVCPSASALSRRLLAVTKTILRSIVITICNRVQYSMKNEVGWEYASRARETRHPTIPVR
jgi:hypothetical protein